MSNRREAPAEAEEGSPAGVSALTLNAGPPVTEQADAALLRAVQRGDERAFEALFDRHYPRVYGIGLRITGSPEDAEELALDVFVRLHRRPLPDDANLAGWLYRVVTNEALNVVRSRKRRAGRLWRFARFSPSASSGSDPFEMVARWEDARRVRRALEQLPERQRAALALRAEGLSYAEVAEAIEVRPGSVGTILARAERALRAAYDEEARERGA